MNSPGFRIVDGQALYSAAWLDDAYDPSDPKHPSYAERLAEAADLQRKTRKESGLTEEGGRSVVTDSPLRTGLAQEGGQR